VGSHHPPAVKAGAGVSVWYRELYGLDKAQGSLGLMYQKGDHMEHHPPKMEVGPNGSQASLRSCRRRGLRPLGYAARCREEGEARHGC
jgi:hypothetical protein